MKAQVKDMIDEDGFKAFKSSNRAFQQNDSGILLSRYLTAVTPRVLTVKYPELAFGSLGMAVDNEGGVANAILTRRTKELGGFGGTGDNRGKISLAAENTTIPVSIREAEATWSNIAVQQAAMTNFNLVEAYMKAAVKMFNQDVDTSALVGFDDKENKITNFGIANNAHYVGAAATAKFDTLTADEKYDFIADEITAQHNKVNNTAEYMANKCLLPTSVFNDAQRAIRNDLTNGSVLKALRENFPTVDFVHSSKMEKVADSTGVETKRMVLFSNHEDAVTFRLPVPFTLTPIEQRLNDFHVIATYHTAGSDILEGTSGRIVTGL